MLVTWRCSLCFKCLVLSQLPFSFCFPSSLIRKKTPGLESAATIRTKVFVWGLNDKDQLGGLKGSKVPIYALWLTQLLPVASVWGLAGVRLFKDVLSRLFFLRNSVFNSNTHCQIEFVRSLYPLDIVIFCPPKRQEHKLKHVKWFDNV